MRRYALAGLLLGTTLLTGPTAHAAGISKSVSHNLRTLLATRTPSGFAQRGSLHLESVPDSRVGAAAGQQAASLRLPDSAFSPATLNQQYVGTEDAAAADSNFFRSNHSTSYGNLGFVTGYYERADWQPSSGGDTIVFRYQGSVYSSANAALNAWSDGVTHTKSADSGTYQDCASITELSSQPNAQCGIIGYTNGTIDDLYVAVQINQCMVEAAAEMTDAAYTAQKDQIGTTLAAISDAAIKVVVAACNTSSPPQTSTPAPTSTPTPVQTPQPTPAPPPTLPPVTPPSATPTPPPAQTPTDFSLIAVRLEKNKAKPDYDQVTPPLKQVKVGMVGQISVYFTVKSAPASAPITFHFTIQLRGHTIVDKTFSDHLLADATGTYVYHYRPLKLTRAGKYTADVLINSGGQAADGFANFTVVHKAPRVAPPVSFTFDSLLAVNGRNQPQDSFRPGDRVGYDVNWTVKNLTGKVAASIIGTYQYPSRGGWRPYGHPALHIVTASDGPNLYGDSFVLPTYPYNSLRIVVGITIGTETQRKAVTIHVNH